MAALKSKIKEINLDIFTVGKGYKSKCESEENNIIKPCKYLHRLSTALKYYNVLKTSNNKTAQELFTQFAVEVYHDLLDDISHLHSKHGHETQQIKAELISKYKFRNCEVKDCLFSHRHYDEIQASESNDVQDPQYTFYEELMDEIHFNIFHLYDVGLRVDIDDMKQNNNDDVEDEYDCIDNRFAAVRDSIYNKRKQFAFDRFDTENNKYNIKIGYNLNKTDNDKQIQTESVVNNKANKKKENVWKSLRRTVSNYFANDDDEKDNDEKIDEVTWADNMFEYMINNGVDRLKMIAVYQVFHNEEYDTDAVIAEFEADNEEKQRRKYVSSDVRFSVILIKEPAYDAVALYNLANSEECIVSIQNYIKNTKLSTFSTGLTFWYWDYYHPSEIKKRQKKNKEYDASSFNINDYAGYQIGELFIDGPKYKDLKEEIINSGYCTMKQFIEKIELKSKKYMDSNTAKTFRADSDGMIGNLKNLHYGIKRNSPLLLHHLQAVICYCDNAKLCTSFSSTFRAVFIGETLSSIKKRNQCYYYMSVKKGKYWM